MCSDVETPAAIRARIDRVRAQLRINGKGTGAIEATPSIAASLASEGDDDFSVSSQEEVVSIVWVVCSWLAVCM